MRTSKARGRVRRGPGICEQQQPATLCFGQKRRGEISGQLSLDLPLSLGPIVFELLVAEDVGLLRVQRHGPEPTFPLWREAEH